MTNHIKVIDKLKSPDIRKILTNNTKIIHKYNNKSRLLILEATTTKNLKNTINKIAFTTSINILNIFNN